MALNPKAVADEAMIPASEVEAIIAARVQANLAAEVENITATIMANLAANFPAPPAASTVPDANMLAMAIAQLTDQGSGRKRVAPEVQQAREQARYRMEVLIDAARAEGRAAQYELRQHVYFDEVLVQPKYIDQWHRPQPTIIEWPMAPNSAMIAVNDTAKAIYAEYAAWIGEVKPPAMPAQKMTAKGLVIVTSSNAPPPDVDQVGGMSHGTAGQGLKIAGGRPGASETYEDVNILGSIHPPARQSA